MPELPEVETICKSLEAQILNQTIICFKRLTIHNLRKPIPQNIEQKLANKQIIQINRRAKYICIHLDDKTIIILHLGMSGKVLLKERDYIYQKHDHFAICFQGGLQIVYNDPRRFGLIELSDEETLSHQPLFKGLGAEPLSGEFTVRYLVNLLSKKKQPIKLAIMDNENIVGVGNIYASESLFLSKILPTRPANSLSLSEVTLLREKIIEVLEIAIKQGGSSIRDYASVNGESGYFQHFFKVYGREGENCTICNSKIIKIKQAGRASFYCSNCQK